MAKRIGWSLFALLVWVLATVLADSHPADFGNSIAIAVVQSVIVFGFAAELVRLALVQHMGSRAAIATQLVTAYVGGAAVRALLTFGTRPGASTLRLALGAPRGPWIGVLWFVLGNVLLPFVMIGLVYWRASMRAASSKHVGEPLESAADGPA